jgi:gas vesicle protein
MFKELIMIGASILMLVLTLTNYLSAHATINDSNTAGNMTALVKQTSTEVGHNVSTAMNETGEEVSIAMNETGEEVSTAMNETGEEVRSTLNQLGHNLSDVGSEIGAEILNETEKTAKKVGIGAAEVLSNISGEIKEGLRDK